MRTIRTLLVFLALAIPAIVFGQIGIRIAIGPPALPMYEQYICPGDGYLWTPGYWAYDDSVSDYYWVDGAWVLAPETGLLWTPGYWGWGDGGFFFNDGYWGPEVGFYGGINYGFGYFGEGYGGGRWDHEHFFYNSSVSHVDLALNHNVYNTAIENHNGNRVSFNGGKGGIEARPTSAQQTAASQKHIPAIASQTDHAQAARANPASWASVNHGQPSTVAKAMPIGFNDHQTTSPQSATEPRAVVHPNDLPTSARPAAVNSGNTKADQKYEAKQDILIATQAQERQNLQQKQESEHQQTAYKANPQIVEQKHQQQTQQLSQRHAAQQQSLQSRQPQARLSGGGGRR